MADTPARTLVVSFSAYPFSTRPRKSAASYAVHGPTTFVALRAAARAGQWVDAGRERVDGIDVVHLPGPDPRTGRGALTQLINLVWVYLPGFWRLCRYLWTTPAEIVHVYTVQFTLLGLVHRLRHRSVLVLDLNERPVSSFRRGSLLTRFRLIEPAVLRLAARWCSLTLVVAPGHEPLVRRLGFDEIRLVRNVPTQRWRGQFAPPPAGDPLRLLVAGTIFERRGFEALIDSVAAVRPDVQVALDIYGTGDPGYLRELTSRARSLGLEEAVTFHGQVDGSAVAAAYRASHVGVAMYDAQDPANDSLSNKLLESVSIGRPVIAADHPENRAFVTTDKVGWLAAADADSLAAALRAAASSDLDRLARHCREVGDAALNWEQEFGPVAAEAASLARRRSR